MPKRLTIKMCSVLTSLASVPLAIPMIATPAQAHEWFRWDRTVPYPYRERDPSDPNVEAVTSDYRSVTRELGSYRPIDPLPWGDVNKRVTPIPKPPPKQEKGQ
jgi:hypothetical protein